MIDQQLDVFPGQERFESATLGLRSACEQLLVALAVERSDGGAHQDGPLLDFLLGAVSFARTLHAVLDSAARAPRTPDTLRTEEALTAAPAAADARWLR